MALSIQHVGEALEPFGAQNRILEFSVSSATVELAARALNTDACRIAKTLSFMTGEQPILIVMAGDARVDNAKYKQRFKTKPKMMSAEQIFSFTGLSFGGVCPFGIPGNVQIWLDQSLRRFETVYPACGSSNSAIEVTPDELERFSGAQGWVDVGRLHE